MDSAVTLDDGFQMSGQQSDTLTSTKAKANDVKPKPRKSNKDPSSEPVKPKKRKAAEDFVVEDEDEDDDGDEQEVELSDSDEGEAMQDNEADMSNKTVR